MIIPSIKAPILKSWSLAGYKQANVTHDRKKERTLTFHMSSKGGSVRKIVHTPAACSRQGRRLWEKGQVRWVGALLRARLRRKIQGRKWDGVRRRVWEGWMLLAPSVSHRRCLRTGQSAGVGKSWERSPLRSSHDDFELLSRSCCSSEIRGRAGAYTYSLTAFLLAVSGAHVVLDGICLHFESRGWRALGTRHFGGRPGAPTSRFLPVRIALWNFRSSS